MWEKLTIIFIRQFLQRLRTCCRLVSAVVSSIKPCLVLYLITPSSVASHHLPQEVFVGISTDPVPPMGSCLKPVIIIIIIIPPLCILLYSQTSSQYCFQWFTFQPALDSLYFVFFGSFNPRIDLTICISVISVVSYKGKLSFIPHKGNLSYFSHMYCGLFPSLLKIIPSF